MRGAASKTAMNEVPYRIIVIDDLRKPAIPSDDSIAVEIYRTPSEGLAALQKHHDDGLHIDELWLDHDMGWEGPGGDFITIKPVWDWLEEQAAAGKPFDVACIFVHTSNAYAGQQMVAGLSRYYPHVARVQLPVES